MSCGTSGCVFHGSHASKCLHSISEDQVNVNWSITLSLKTYRSSTEVDADLPHVHGQICVTLSSRHVPACAGFGAIRGPSNWILSAPSSAAKCSLQISRHSMCRHAQASGQLEGDVEGVAWALETMVLARRELLPAIQNGNQGCGGRLR
jgi:hypothetical protein